MNLSPPETGVIKEVYFQTVVSNIEEPNNNNSD